jgi:phosphoglycerol transferase MdoB-like AlkP superfamily enzyme
MVIYDKRMTIERDPTMTDHSMGLPGVPATGVSSRAIAVPWAPPRLQRATVWPGAVVLWGGMGVYFWQDEGDFFNVLFTVGVTAALIAVTALLSRRVLFASVVIAALVTMTVAAASAKRATMNMVVHAYDLFFYLGSLSTVSYLWSDQRRYILGAAGAVAAVAILAGLAFRFDGTRVCRRRTGVVLALCVLLAWYGAASKGERRHMQFYYENLYVSSFYASWGETLEAFWRGALLEADPHSGVAPALTIPERCEPAAQSSINKPQHVILIHQESVVQPTLFPTLGYDHAVEPFFRSADGTSRRLRVETYGGASWLTEFSLLAGVSTFSFGNMRQFVQTFMQGRLKDTLPQALARCGYRNVVFYPMHKNFVSNDKFYRSIGLREIFDMKAQGAKSTQERDRFYFDNAMAEMGRHFKASGKPLFTFIQTMSAHWPYDYAFAPEMEVAGGDRGTDPEMHEYLRRLSLAKMDYDYLVKELRRRFPRERFLIVHYGDHHPLATRTLLGYRSETQAEDVALDPDSLGFITYYAAQGVNYKVPALPAYETLDVSYLGSVILDLAGLPLPDSHRERRLMGSKGRYYSCAARESCASIGA